MADYVKLTFRPHGAKRNSAVWAKRLSHGTFMQVNKHGDEAATPTIIICGLDLDVGAATVKPATFSRQYGWLVLAKEA